MIASMVVLAPHGEVEKTLPAVRLATHKLIVSVDAVVRVELLATTLESFVTDITGVNLLSLVLCPPTLTPSSKDMISLINRPSTPAGPGASR